ncbi:carboxymuconolactone decarboxylase family protein, partial [Microvirga brassicacearum]
MTPRLENPFKVAPEGIKAMMALEATLKASGLELGLLELVKLRASQINGCAYCIHMHA